MRFLRKMQSKTRMHATTDERQHVVFGKTKVCVFARAEASSARSRHRLLASHRLRLLQEDDSVFCLFHHIHLRLFQINHLERHRNATKEMQSNEMMMMILSDYKGSITEIVD